MSYLKHRPFQRPNLKRMSSKNAKDLDEVSPHRRELNKNFGGHSRERKNEADLPDLEHDDNPFNLPFSRNKGVEITTSVASAKSVSSSGQQGTGFILLSSGENLDKGGRAASPTKQQQPQSSSLSKATASDLKKTPEKPEKGSMSPKIGQLASFWHDQKLFSGNQPKSLFHRTTVQDTESLFSGEPDSPRGAGCTPNSNSTQSNPNIIISGNNSSTTTPNPTRSSPKTGAEPAKFTFPSKPFEKPAPVHNTPTKAPDSQRGSPRQAVVTKSPLRPIDLPKLTIKSNENSPRSPILKPLSDYNLSSRAPPPSKPPPAPVEAPSKTSVQKSSSEGKLQPPILAIPRSPRGPEGSESQDSKDLSSGLGLPKAQPTFSALNKTALKTHSSDSALGSTANSGSQQYIFISKVPNQSIRVPDDEFFKRNVNVRRERSSKNSNSEKKKKITPDPNEMEALTAIGIQEDDSEFEMKEIVGRGSYGVVYRATSSRTKQELAIKVVPINHHTVTEIIDLKRERELIERCSHANIVGYYGSVTKKSELWILMEYSAGGSVSDLLTSTLSLQEEAVIAIMEGTCKGCAYLHTLGIIHRDIKAGNILLTADGRVKIADFGVSADLRERSTRMTITGSPYWMAPEIMKETGYNEKADVWSIGITTIEIAQGAPPHWGQNAMHAIIQIPLLPSPTLNDPSTRSSNLNSFISHCLVKEPEKRPSCAMLLEHPLFLQNTNSFASLENPLVAAIRMAKEKKALLEDQPAKKLRKFIIPKRVPRIQSSYNLLPAAPPTGETDKKGGQSVKPSVLQNCQPAKDQFSGTMAVKGDDELSGTMAIKGDDELSGTMAIKGDDELSGTMAIKGDDELSGTMAIIKD